ncbi:dihydrodipicolinate synthase family protein [Microbispora sp. NPDC046933]|uniref:dihydrodipicolinate synthase family protein n=1 Tax=Microbispora sp. NPDC046933 TaxID=3155618 RepID=UPI003404B5B2
MGKPALRVHGVIPPIVTPLDADQEVDVPSLRRLVDFVIDAGVHVVFALGTGGEGPYLTPARRDQVLDVVTEAVGGRVPVLAGASDIGTARAVDNAKAVERAGADGIVITPPFYGEVTQAEIDRHFRQVADAVSVPLVAYDIPSKVHSKLAWQTTLKLAEDGVIVAVKDTSGEETSFRRLIDETSGIDGFSVITGSDVTCDSALLQGAAGMIVGMGNVDPHGFVRLYTAAVEGRWTDARAEQDRLARLRYITQVAGDRISGFSATISSFKAALVARGVIGGDTTCDPLLPLNDAERAEVERILTAADLHKIG